MLFDESPRAGARQLRQFAAALLVMTTAVAAMRWRRYGLIGTPVALSALAGWTIGVIGLVAPSRIAWLFHAVSALTRPIGRVVSELVVLLLYFGIVTPIALVCRLAGRDRLQRRFDRQAASYWVRREPEPGIEHYFRQS
jgi:EamA domain-containing membrane protein RarD